MSPSDHMTCLDDLSVVLGDSTLRFTDRHVSADPRDIRWMLSLVQARAPGLSARLERVASLDAGLAEFIDGLDYRGWDGSVAWEDPNRDLGGAGSVHLRRTHPSNLDTPAGAA
jgi:hypothetical protein